MKLKGVIRAGLKRCRRCRCCSAELTRCWSCGGKKKVQDQPDADGRRGALQTLVDCGVCEGKGGWQTCLGGCDEVGGHAPAVAA
jgi:hypothetical protein